MCLHNTHIRFAARAITLKRRSLLCPKRAATAKLTLEEASLTACWVVFMPTWNEHQMEIRNGPASIKPLATPFSWGSRQPSDGQIAGLNHIPGNLAELSKVNLHFSSIFFLLSFSQQQSLISVKKKKHLRDQHRLILTICGGKENR